MQPDSRHAKDPALRHRSFASPQTNDARWLRVHRNAPSSTHRWRDHARQGRRIAEIPSSSWILILIPRILRAPVEVIRIAERLRGNARQRVVLLDDPYQPIGFGKGQ